MQDLMSLGLDKVMLLISSYSNPVETLQHARRQGYILRDFMVTAMPFGKYSSEPKVRLSWSTLPASVHDLYHLFRRFAASPHDSVIGYPQGE